MTARVLVVDDILANVKLLEARLSAEYFQVLTAFSGQGALEVLKTERVDVVLLDVMMPGMDGFEVCRRIKHNPGIMHLPVIMVTALDQLSDKIQGLKAGADDLLTKPIDETALITRVRNLARLKTLNDEMLRRVSTGAEFGLPPPALVPWSLVDDAGARILLVEDQERVVQRVVAALTKTHTVDVEPDIQAALMRLGAQPYDVAIVSLTLKDADGLRLCGQIRALERLRELPIITVTERSQEARLLRALDMGVNDYLVRPLDRHELLARVRTQIRRKRHCDLLRTSLDASVELAITDPLTGLFNRRYLESNLAKLAQRARAAGGPLSLLLADIDHFKSVNDTHGHLVGDHVLREFAGRLRHLMRASDLVCRLGGEEFIIVMPDTSLEDARHVGERLCASIAAEPFQSGGAAALKVTASVGVATLGPPSEGVDALLKRVDLALYCAKREGRNRVVADAA
jgi:two-component system cell cycle response regulator